jgi:hypothetical protein
LSILSQSISQQNGLQPTIANKQGGLVDTEDFRRIALSFEGAEESSHMSQPDFRVGGRIFATLAAQHMGFGNLMLTRELQQSLIAHAPDVFLPIPGGWGRNGATHIRLSEASEQQLDEALHLAWQLRVEKNEQAMAAKKRQRGRKK